MTFKKTIVNSKKGKTAFVSFLACEYPEIRDRLESVMIQTKAQSVDKLHITLKGVACEKCSVAI